MGAYYSGSVKSVEGYVENYCSKSMDSTVKVDSFSINNINFSYASLESLGFDNQNSGIIAEGDYLEIYYIFDFITSQNVIVYIARVPYIEGGKGKS